MSQCFGDLEEGNYTIESLQQRNRYSLMKLIDSFFCAITFQGNSRMSQVRSGSQGLLSLLQGMKDTVSKETVIWSHWGSEKGKFGIKRVDKGQSTLGL